MAATNRLSLLLFLAFVASWHFDSMICAQAAEGSSDDDVEETNVEFEEEEGEDLEEQAEEDDEEASEEGDEDGSEESDEESDEDSEESDGEDDEGSDEESGDEESGDEEVDEVATKEAVVASFVNKHDKPAWIFWHDPRDGEEKMLAEIAPHSVQSLNTFADSEFLLRGGKTPDDPLLASFTTTEEEQQMHVYGEDGEGASHQGGSQQVVASFENKQNHPVWIFFGEKMLAEVAAHGVHSLNTFAGSEIQLRGLERPDQLLASFTITAEEKQTHILNEDGSFTPERFDKIVLTIHNQGPVDVDIMWKSPDHTTEDYGKKIAVVKAKASLKVDSYAHQEFAVLKSEIGAKNKFLMKLTTSGEKTQEITVKDDHDEL